MTRDREIRNYIRQVLEESVNNFIKKEPETAPKQLKNSSKFEVLGDPLDIKLNQMVDELGSDGKNTPTVSVSVGAKKSGNGPQAGQHQANFKNKTIDSNN